MNTKYEAANGWAYDRCHSQSLWLRRCLLACSVLLVMLGISVVSNFMLFPLKQRVPYLYAFNQTTGEVNKLGQLQPADLSNTWQLTRYFLIRYVVNRESYDIDNIDVPYQMVWAQSSENVRQQYEFLVQSDNERSPYQTYGKDAYIVVNVNSVNRLNDNTVDVKFTKTLHNRGTNTEKVINKEAIVKWAFVDAEITQHMLDRDPLGFKVTYYQATQVDLAQSQEK